jgi:hypothetical protein
MIEITLAGFKKLVHPLQVKAYESFGWKPTPILGANQETPQPKAVGATPKTKKVKK